MTNRAADTVRGFFITVAGSGFAPFASGTWGSLGSLVPFVFLWIIAGLAGWSQYWVDVVLFVATVVACALSVIWGPWAVSRFGRKDPSEFVLDEAAGQYIALLFLPVAIGADFTAVACVIAGQFLLFRFFDILKPPPARQLEAYPAGWGILLDDLFAGLYANIVGQLIWRVSPASTWFDLVGEGAPG